MAHQNSFFSQLVKNGLLKKIIAFWIFILGGLLGIFMICTTLIRQSATAPVFLYVIGIITMLSFPIAGSYFLSRANREYRRIKELFQTGHTVKAKVKDVRLTRVMDQDGVTSFRKLIAYDQGGTEYISLRVHGRHWRKCKGKEVLVLIDPACPRNYYLILP